MSANLVLVSHTNFRGNSAMHVFSIATELQKLGYECCLLVPDAPESVHEHGEPTFEVMDYDRARARGVRFSDGKPPDIVHAWSPREHVRWITEDLVARYGCAYVVHMEDNEEQIIEDELANLEYADLRRMPDALVDSLIGHYRSHPRRYRAFLEGASGYSCLIDRLLEFKPEAVPGVVFWPGFDAPFAELPPDARRARRRYGLAENDCAVLYSGNVHASTAADIKKLYIALGLLRRRGFPVKLVRTGWTYADFGLDERHGIGEYVTDLGFVRRSLVPTLVGMSDILIQPGRSDRFNDYRFPSKLPEYLVSGRPVILPDSNIGKELEDGYHALKLRDGSIVEMCARLVELIESPALRARLGANARAFALRELSWERAAATLDRLYRTMPRRRTSPATVCALPASDPNAPPLPVDVIAFYLPQFHPIPENDRWWGKGFTEWTNVVRARPNFAGHAQPRLPTELGFYDLRVAEVLHEQARLAKSYGLGGFCFYYYWFNGRRLLERPLDLWLSAAGPDFPFCICWANESWSRRWDGSEADVLLQQTYDAGTGAAFITDVLPILADPRYLRVDGAPMLLVYRAAELTYPIAMTQLWRETARRNGIERLHLVAVGSFGLGDPRPYGFDAAIEFSPPHFDRMLLDPRRIHGVPDDFAGYLEDYVSVAMRSINEPPADYVRYRGAFPRWDNTARRGARGHTFVNDSPKAYGQWLRYLVREALHRRDQQQPMVFVNAWNEWAEGTYLEPDQMYGRGLLEVTRLAIWEGIVDFERGPTPERERAFTERVSILPGDVAG